MRRTMLLGALLGLAVSCVLTSPADAKLKKVGQAGFKFLSNPIGARGSGLGNAYLAIAEDASAMFWNPAGLARLDNGSAFFDATRGIADINYFAGAAAWNFGDYGVFGLNAVMMDYGDFMGTRLNPITDGYDITGNFSPSAFAVGLSYARTMTDRFGFGGTVKWAQVDMGPATSIQVTETDNAGNVTGVESTEVRNKLNIPVFDVGVMYYTHIRGIRFGAAFQNFSQEKKFIADEFSLPLMLKFGAAADLVDLLSLHGLGANHAATVSSDFQHSRDYSSRLHYGVEYWYRGALALRGGYKSNYDEEAWTFGAGLRGTLENYAIQFDYAYNDYGVFQPVHKFSIGLQF